MTKKAKVVKWASKGSRTYRNMLRELGYTSHGQLRGLLNSLTRQGLIKWSFTDSGAGHKINLISCK